MCIKYPADFQDANLRCIDSLKKAFGVPVGFSNNGFISRDGAIDFEQVPVTAAACGMDLYETHITLDRSMDGVDQGFSTEPAELKVMVNLINNARDRFREGGVVELNPLLLGNGVKRTLEAEEYVRRFAYKSIFSSTHIRKGEKLTPENIRCLRPGEYQEGLAPLFFDILVENFYARHEILAFEPRHWTDLTS